MGIFRQEFARKGGLTYAVWARNDVEIWAHLMVMVAKCLDPVLKRFVDGVDEQLLLCCGIRRGAYC
jgi:hypothetical protein